MPTVRQLADNPCLGLTLCAGYKGADQPISWVHASELTDPAQFLSGSELLLTTGLALPERADGQAAYIERLAKAGLAGLGFGTELGHDVIPTPLLEAADQVGLPVLEVPHEIPFIEISKTVWHALADRRGAEARRAESARQALTTTALSADDLGELVGALADKLMCWAVLLDSTGQVVYAQPACAAKNIQAIAADLDRLRGWRPPSSASLATEGDFIAAQSLGGGHRLHGFLVLGRDVSFNATDHNIMHVACSLLTIALVQSRPVATAPLKTAALNLLLASNRAAFDEIAGPLGVTLPAGPAVVLAMSGDTVALVNECAGTGILAGEREGKFVAVAPQSWRPVSARHLGVSAPASLDELEDACRQAHQALDDATRRGVAVSHFDHLGEALLNHLGSQDVVTRAEALLRPLREHDKSQRGDLMRSLRAWLAQHGQWEPAAATLGVHRHTLRLRLRKVAELAGCDLDSPDIRAELWVALRLLE